MGRTARAACAGAYLLAAAGGARPALAEERPLVWYRGEREGVAVAFDLGEISVADFMKIASDLTGGNYVVNGEIAGKIITVSEKTRVPWRDTAKAVSSALSSHGIKLVRDGQMTMVVPEGMGRALTDLAIKRSKEPGDGALSPEKVSLDLDRVDLRSCAALFGDFTGGKYVLRDDLKKVTVSIMTPGRVDKQLLPRVFETILNANGLTLKPSAGADEIVPLAEGPGK